MDSFRGDNMPGNEKLQHLPEDWERALAVVAHPDDLESATASAVARWTSQGKQVVYLIATKGEAGIDSIEPAKVGPLRVQEEINSAQIVGVNTVEFLDHPDGVIEGGLPLRRDIALAIRKHRPDVLITMSYEPSDWSEAPVTADHRVVGLAAVDAAHDAGNRCVFPEQLRDGLQPWNGIRMVCLACLASSDRATHGVDVTDFIDKGVASLRAHRVYLENLSQKIDPDTMLRSQAEATGKLFGCRYAQAFQVFSP